MKLRFSILLCLWIGSFYTIAQAPNTQIYLFDWVKAPDGNIALHTPKILTAFNSKGYNNQPFFINENELLVTVQLPQANQTDIYKLNFTMGTKQQITQTTQSEYSPTLTKDRARMSCVRVDNPADATQRLYIYDLAPQGKISSPLPDIKNIGYHTWLEDKSVALFLVNKPSQLAIVHTGTKDPLVFSSDVGRCMTSNEQGHLIYVHKISDEYWYIKDYDPTLQKASIITQTLPGVEDFVMMSDGSFLMGKGSKLYRIKPGAEKSWTELADLKYFGLSSISRLAIHGKHLALVNQVK